jgi:lipopolysaccharide transport system ATP-binding protein
MNNTVISVEHLSKTYCLGQIGTGTFTHDLEVWWAKMRGKPNPMLRIGEKDHGNRDGEELWALKDVSFTVQQGEVLGIIGRNGAGKSTLLKVLSRVTAPTSGKIKVMGRIASLLEVGTGFHPDLTGRENVYLNGAILGMDRKEIERKFDEIVDFSEVEKFIDTPVKRYSSGMYVRLAFAVAAHLDPEILLVDEVLAVGDAEFQKKCLGKMGDVAGEGRTVLFVSHNMGAISKLCKRAVMLNHGLIAEYQSVSKAISDYLLNNSKAKAQAVWEKIDDVPGDDCAKLLRVSVSQDNQISEVMQIEKPITIEVIYKNYSVRKKVTAIIQIINSEGVILLSSNDWNNKVWWNSPRKKGVVTANCEIPGHFLAEGIFFINVALGSYNPNLIHVIKKEIISFEVVDNNVGESVKGYYTGNWSGLIRPMFEWKVNFEEDH